MTAHSASACSAPLAACEITDATGGCLVGGEGLATGVSTDTRTLRRGDLFVALRGERFDGHDFLAEAISRGAAGVLVQEAPAEMGEAFVVVVDDTGRALLALAAAYRRAMEVSVVGITGSCGKTSTKEMASHLLGSERRVIAAERSFNNHVGVPLTLFRVDEQTDVALVEIGTTAPGEVAELADVAQPDVALVTMIGRAHLAGLGSLAGVLREKGALLEAVAEQGVAVLNADDPFTPELARRSRAARTLRFGLRAAADITADSLRPTARGVALRIVATEAGQVHAVELPRAGQHDVRNLLAALCIGRALGVELEAMLARVSTLSPVPRRLEPKLAKNGVAILDDTYNANPESLLAALTVLDASTVATARVLVLGDMLELGDDAAAIHAVVGEQLVGRVDRLVTVGSLAAQAGEAFVELTGNAGGWTRFDDVDQVSSVLPELFQSGDLVLFKASRGVALDRAVDALVGSA
ncbi:MAG: hypothetical protein CMJ85_12240 [Planctomycetes bacterium]|jgi:UDP-N-acetylmuramoyl-tripeptide--D-alanyl-D-alanine ligase|nr:hypothetical protein [Planctomycetota bacterium]